MRFPQERGSREREGKKGKGLAKQTMGSRAKESAIANPGSDHSLIPCPSRGRDRCPAGFPRTEETANNTRPDVSGETDALHLLSVSSQPNRVEQVVQLVVPRCSSTMAVRGRRNRPSSSIPCSRSPIGFRPTASDGPGRRGLPISSTKPKSPYRTSTELENSKVLESSLPKPVFFRERGREMEVEDRPL